MPGKIFVETDPESGAEIFLLTDDSRPADNMYGEQPYTNRQANRIAVRFYPAGNLGGELSILDLYDGSLHTVLEESPPKLPAFHAWGDYLYFKRERGGRRILCRCGYTSLKTEDVCEIPPCGGNLSYGTVSQDHRFYAVSLNAEDRRAKLLLLDIANNSSVIAAEEPGRHFKHEQFSPGGENLLLLQADEMPGKERVDLAVYEAGCPELSRLPANPPFTPRPTGHEAWLGETRNVLFSTGRTPESRGNLWTAGYGERKARLLCETSLRFGHVTASRCGEYWAADAFREEEVSIYAGSVSSGRHRKLLESRTRHDGNQWSHTHPYLTADNKWMIYTSNRGGAPQVYGAKIPPGFLESL